MKFRTQIELKKSASPLTLSERLSAVGSCFSCAIGSRLREGGFDIDVASMGPLFNPVSIARTIDRALNGPNFSEADLYADHTGTYHLLWFESTRRGINPARLLEDVNRDFDIFSRRLKEADAWLVTFGTAWCFYHEPTRSIVGNCHKLPDEEFTRVLYPVNKIVALWENILEKAPRVIFTVSPVRHLNDGLHGNTLSKAILHLAIDHLCRRFPNAEYFPAYEALVDDLRDYRFYADDLKHPSKMAEEYIFELFAENYFVSETRKTVAENRHKHLMTLHRPIIQP